MDPSNIVECVDGTMHRRIEGDFEYKENGDVEYNGKVIDKSSILPGDHDNEIYVRCGMVFNQPGYEENTLYLVNGNIFEQYHEEKYNCEIEKWGDGNYYKILNLRNEEKLKDKVIDLKI